MYKAIMQYIKIVIFVNKSETCFTILVIIEVYLN